MQKEIKYIPPLFFPKILFQFQSKEKYKTQIFQKLKNFQIIA